ncbi:MAG: M20/M25/M40 family metallo-hydrolase, partial [Candidatus Omnitrophica bacterium]|nr:M20/M25/M40 family metallo-hydrolase [Candidatus Omnitrophota bacterium]
QPPYVISKAGDILVKKMKELAKELGVPLKISGSEGATVLSFFKDKDILAVAFGFGTKGKSHSRNEFVKIEDLYKGAVFLERLLKEKIPTNLTH